MRTKGKKGPQKISGDCGRILIKILAAGTGVERRWVQSCEFPASTLPATRLPATFSPRVTDPHSYQLYDFKAVPGSKAAGLGHRRWISNRFINLCGRTTRFTLQRHDWTAAEALTTQSDWCVKQHGNTVCGACFHFWLEKMKKEPKRRHNQSGKQLMREKSSTESLPCSPEVALPTSSVQINFVSLISAVLGLRDTDKELLTEMAVAYL